MKITFFLLLLTFISCNSTNFKVGDCIQKPDSPFIWQVLSLEEKDMSITNLTTKEEIAKIEPISSSWIKTSCPK